MHTLQIWNSQEQEWQDTDIESPSYAWVARELELMQLRAPITLRIVSNDASN